MSRLDKIIENVAPEWAMRRSIARHDLRKVNSWGGWSGSAYESGNTNSRARKHAAFGRSQNVDEETAAGEFGYDAMRLEAMDLYRNNPTARGIVETTRRYMRQSKPRANTSAILEAQGFDKAQIDAAADWDLEATDYFMGYWWPRADALRRPGVTFGTLQDMFVTLQFTQGDLSYVWTGDGFLAIEGIQIRTPSELRKESNIRHGFRFNGKGQITHMYVCGFGKYGNVDEKNFTRYPISSVIYCPWYWRAAQTRAVPRLHGVIDCLRDQEEIHGNVKTKVKHEASLLSIERAGSRKAAPGSKLTNSDGTETTYEKSDFGMRFKTSGKPGEDFILANGNAPNAQYVPLMEYDAKIIASGSGIPYKILMNMWDGSWSSNKAAQSALKTFITELHEHRKAVFTQRAYNVIMAQGIREGHVPPAPLNKRGISLFNACEWSKPYFPQLDQEKEEKGRSMAFRNMTQSQEDWADEQGTTAEQLRREHKKNIQAMQADAKELGIPFETYAAGLIAGSSSISANSTTTEVTQ
jgi:capsid protein